MRPIVPLEEFAVQQHRFSTGRFFGAEGERGQLFRTIRARKRPCSNRRPCTHTDIRVEHRIVRRIDFETDLPTEVKSIVRLAASVLIASDSNRVQIHETIAVLRFTCVSARRACGATDR